MMKADVAVLDYGSGNLRSVVRAVERGGASVVLTADFETAARAAGLVVPGVGAYAECMRGLRAVQGDRIVGRRLAGARPVLGICVGMQAMFGQGIEHGMVSEGCAEWPGTVERLEADVIPHMGWNTVEAATGSQMFAGIDDERFYFAHSYGVRAWELRAEPPFPSPQVTWTTYGPDRFVSAAENGPLWATQFHPEKSGDAGAALLRNWLGQL